MRELMNPPLLPLKAGLPAIGLVQHVLMVLLYPFWMNTVLVIQEAPPSVETSTTPPSYVLSSVYWCQKLRNAIVAKEGMAIGLVVTSIWSETPAKSGAKAELAPVCGVGTAVQPQPP